MILDWGPGTFPFRATLIGPIVSLMFGTGFGIDLLAVEASAGSTKYLNLKEIWIDQEPKPHRVRVLGFEPSVSGTLVDPQGWRCEVPP